MGSMEGRTAIVTGASRGIGKQIAVELGRQGANVVVAARTVDPHKRLPGTIGDTLAAVEAAGGSAVAVRTDMAAPADLQALVDTTLATFGRIDALVNNAADTAAGATAVADVSYEHWARQFEVNLHGPVLLMKAVVGPMTDQGGGVIVNMTSGAGDLVPPGEARSGAFPELLAYAATKAALNRLANAAAPELASRGIAVVNVDPGFTRTELVDLMGERGLVDPEAAVPMDIPTRTVVHLLTSDPMPYTGSILRAAEFVEREGL